MQTVPPSQLGYDSYVHGDAQDVPLGGPQTRIELQIVH